MNLDVYHQLGYRYQWNLQSLKDDHTGDGVILAPRYMSPEVIRGLNPGIRRNAIFDPQFFLPEIPRGKLSEYQFFPSVTADTFETREYVETFAEDCARGCIDFQLEIGARYVVIPSRYEEGMPSDFIRRQQSQFVDPCLRVIRGHHKTMSVILQVIINDGMIKDDEYSADLLNWITSFRDIKGVYLILSASRRGKQIKDPELLYRLLHFIYALGENDLEVVVGYINTESVLLSIANPQIVTIGSYETTRMFGLRPFQRAVRTKMQGPVPRLYVSKLLQWIDHRYVGAVERARPGGESVFDQNHYQAIMFTPTYNWHFSKPELYKHFFFVFSKQLKAVGRHKDVDRYRYVVELMEEARSRYSTLEGRGVVFDPDSDGSHLPYWLTAANQFAADIGWR